MNSTETRPQCRDPSGGGHVRPPHFLVGKDGRGQWAVRERDAPRGRLFSNRTEALRFAFHQRGVAAGAVVLVPDILEAAATDTLGATGASDVTTAVREGISTGGLVMSRLCAQGDILIERVDEVPATGRTIRSVTEGSVVIAEGEATGHHHRLFGSVTMYRDDALAREIPSSLYVGHVQVNSPTARLEHEEHAPITLPQGTYRVRRQRHLEPTDIGIHEHFATRED